MALIAAAAATLVFLASPGRAAAAACETSGPPASGYTVTVCITDPADGTTATGTRDVTATATATGASPGVRRMAFYLDGQYLLTDYSSPYTFTIPSAKFADGVRTLEVEALMRDNFVSTRGGISLVFANGNPVAPPRPTGFTPKIGTTPGASRPFIAAAVGDGAGGEQSASDVVSMIGGWDPNLLLYLGDVYEKGSVSEFHNWYRPDLYYGKFAAITDPTIGNHEWSTALGDAPGYFDYWASPPEYYSFDTNGWHIISLNSNGSGGKKPGSPQYDWLSADLKSNTQPCTLAFWHHPLYNIGEEGPDSSMADIWQLLASNGVPLVLNGHDHTYQRWVPLDASGNPVASGGTMEIVDGTGGHDVGQFITSDPRIAASDAREFGALRLELNRAGFAFQYRSVAGRILDFGSMPCRPTIADVTQPSSPTNLVATPVSSNEVDLTWNPGLDNVGVVGYDVYRDGTQIAQVGPQLTFDDTSAAPAKTYEYRVKARDAAGNISGFSTPVNVTTPGKAAMFSDNFESGDLSRWTGALSFSAQQSDVFAGSWGGRATSAGNVSYAYKQFATEQPDLYFRIHFKVASQSTVATLMRFKTASGALIGSLFVSNTSKLGYKNEVTGIATTGATAAAKGAWHTAEVHLSVNGLNGVIETWLDGVKLADLSKTDNFGTAAIGRIELGESALNRTYDISFDDVAADAAFIADTTPPSAPTNVAATSQSGAQVDVSWAASTDDTGVAGYDVFRNGTLLTSLGNVTSYSDATVTPHSSYTYHVRARDAAGNVSAFSSPASVTTNVIFGDGFESGGLASWTSATSVTAQQLRVYTGSWAAEAASSGAAAYLSKNLGSLSELYARVRFQIVSQGSTAVGLLRLRNAQNGAIVTVSVTSAGKLSLRDEVTGVTTTSTVAVAPLAWHELQLHAVVNDPASSTDVWLDGQKIDALSKPDSYGTAPVSALEVGDSSTGHVFDAVFDDVLVDSSFVPDTTPPTAPSGLTAKAGSSAIDLAWSASADLQGVAAYVVSRNGAVVATVGGTATSYRDTSVSTGVTYTYTVAARDPAGNVSAASNQATAAIAGLDSTAPTAPTNVTATAAAATRVDVSWSAATDNVGVVAYAVYRDGTKIADLDGAKTSYSDLTALPSTTYSYTVRASDAAGNASAASAPASATTPAAMLLDDGFESGDLARWTNSGIVVQQTVVYGGSWAARATGSGAAASAYATLSPAVSQADVRVRFQLVSQGANSVNLFRVRTAAGGSILTAFLTSTGKLGYRNDVAGTTATSTVSGLGAWHTLQMHVAVGSGGAVETWLDGALVAALSQSESLGSASVGRLEIGDSTTGRTFDLALDDVLVGTSSTNDTQPPTAPANLVAVAASASQVDLTWSAATDNQSVAAYEIARDGVVVGTVGGTTTKFSDTTASPGTAYSYAVRALDGAANRSSFSLPAAVTTPSADGGPPSAPSNLRATAASGFEVDLSWTAATDDVGVTTYTIYRDGAVLTTVSAPATSYADRSVSPSTSYVYTVKAHDAAGNESAASDPANATTPHVVVFSDDFENGLGSWTTVTGIVTQEAEHYSGAWAARATSSGAAAFATKQLPNAVTSLYARVRFRIVTQSTTATLLRLRGPANAPLASFFASATGNLGYRNDATGGGSTSTTSVAGGWHELQAHVDVAQSRVDVWVDGQVVAGLSGADTFSSASIARLDLGDSSTGRTYDVAFDDVLADTAFVPDTTPPSIPPNFVATAATNRVDLSWGAASDLQGVASYEVLRDGVLLATVASTKTTFADTTVAPNTTYAYAVRAVDVAGNRSPETTPATITTAVDVTAPSVPLGMTAAVASPTTVDLSWNKATDDVGVTGYTVYRNGVALTDLDALTTIYRDATALPSKTYDYAVAAFDLAGNRSAPSIPATVTTPHQVLLDEGFESGTLSGWTVTGNVVAQQAEAFSGSWALRATATGSAAYATHALPLTLPELYYRARFKVVSLGPNPVHVMRFRTATGSPIAGPLVTSTGKLGYRDDVTGQTKTSVNDVSLGTWHELQAHIVVGDPSSSIEFWLDGVHVDSISGPDTFGTTPVGRVGIGDASSDRSFDLVVDDALVDTSFVPDSLPPTAPTGIFATSSPSGQTVNLVWSASFDNQQIASYAIYRDGVRLAVVDGSTRSYADNSVSTSTTYTYTIKAVDSAGNASPYSDPVAVTTQNVDVAAPTTPEVSATVVSSTQVDVSWTAATDNVAVTGYHLYRNGTKIADFPASTRSYSDTTVSASKIYSYTVDAFDAVGNTSPQSAAATVTMPHVQLLADDFESGSFAAWTSASGASVQSGDSFSGSRAVRVTVNGTAPAYAAKTLASPVNELYYRVRFKLLSTSASSAYLVRLRTAANGAMLAALVTGTGKLGYRDDITGTSTTSTTAVAPGAWHELQVHARVGTSGSLGAVEMWLDGLAVPELTKSEQLGSNGIGRVEVGTSASNQTFDALEDDVLVDTGFIPDTLAPTTPTGLAGVTAASGAINLTWNPSFDNQTVSYKVYRDGSLYATSPTASYADAGVTTGNTYSYAVQAVDVAGNTSGVSPSISVTAADKVAPAAPATLSVTATTVTSASLAWTASLDNVSVAQYTIYRGGAPVATVDGATTSYVDATLQPSKTYTYTVTASDAAGNESVPSPAATATTPADTTAPTVPTGVTATLSGSSVNVAWSASTDDVAVTTYRIYRNGTQIGQTPAPGTTYNDAAPPQGITLSYTIRALDGAGNVSAASTAGTATVPDQTAPTAPSNLTATVISATRVDLAWGAATDNVAVTNYRVFRNGTQIGQTTNNTRTFSDTTAVNGTTYTYWVVAVDAAGNVSPQSNTALATTPDTAPPTAPTGLAATAASATQINLSWNASTDNVGVTGYRIMRNGTQVGTTTASVRTYSDTGLTSGVTYSYTVTAVDAAGNVSAASTAATATTPDVVAPSAPTNVAASGYSTTRIDVKWTAATDNVGVTGYRVFRDGVQLAQVGVVTTYTDSTVAAGTTYTYTVRAVDAAGNVSGDSNAATTAAPFFSDGFEAANFALWTTQTGMTIQSADRFAGTRAARATAKGSPTFASKTLSSTSTNLYFEARVKLYSNKQPHNVMRFETAAGAPIASLQYTNSNRLDYVNDIAATTTAGPAVSTNVWIDLRIHVQINGAASVVEVWQDGVKLAALSKTDSLGTTPIGRIVIGDDVTGRTFDLAFDDIAVSTTQ